MQKIGRLKRVATLSFVLISLVLAQLPVGGQTRRAGRRREPTTSTSRTQQPPAETATAVLSSSARGRQMGVPFETGRLPDSLRKPQGTEDEVAATLAKLVSVRNEQSVSALLAAIMAAGFAVRDSDGALTQTVQPGQGLVFEAWEVAAMAKMYGERRTVTLTYLSDGFKAIPALKRAPLATILLEGIRAHAQDNKSPLRFWARFIVELGRQADEPYDMLAGADAQSVRLDAIQSALIMRRLYGDFYGFGQRGQQASGGFGGDKLGGVSARRATADETQQKSLLVRAGLSKDAPPHFVKARAAKSAQPTQQGSPCGALGKDDASAILDAGATILTTGWDKLLDYVGAVKYAAFLKVANILLAYAKFIATYAALETEISVENPPLVRNTSRNSGQPRNLTARVTMNVGKWENVNCIRTALNVATGLDFSLLSDGPLKDVEVNWHLVGGGAADFYSSGDRGQQIVKFLGTGPRIQDAGTFAGARGAPGTQVGILTGTKTDKDGKAQIILEGSSRPSAIPAPHVAVMKQAVVRTTVKLKGGDIKGDAVDIAGQALGGVAGLISMPTELLYRMDWASTATLTVPVKDWEPCEGAWQGTIAHSVRRTTTFDGGNPATGFIHQGQSSYNFDATINLSRGKATGTAQAEEAFLDQQDTGPGRLQTKNTTRRKGIASYSGELEASVDVDSQGNYGVGFRFPKIMGTSQQTVEIVLPPPKKSSTASSSDPWVADEYIPTIKGSVDPNNPNVITESRTWRSNDGQTEYKFTVKLVRCQ